MKVTRCADGFQIECEGVLVSFRCSPEHPHGFGGSVIEQNSDGTMTVANFHGNGHGGVVCHHPRPWKGEEERNEEEHPAG